MNVSSRRIVRTGRVAAAALLVSVACDAAFANLIADGGFETPLVPAGGYTTFASGGTVGPWNIDCPTGCTGAPDVAIVSTSFMQDGFSFVAQSGSQWLDLTGLTNQRVRISQSIATTIGATYELSFYVGNIVDPTGGPFGTTSEVGYTIVSSGFIGIPLITTVKNSDGAGTTQDWERFTTTFTASGDLTTFSFYNFDSPTDNTNGLDGVDVELISGGGSTGVPEPAQTALLGIGLAAFAVARRARRRQR